MSEPVAGRRCASPRRGLVRGLIVTALALARPSGAAGPDGFAAEAPFDARIQRNLDRRQEPQAAALAAAARLGHGVPELAVTYDDLTGAARSVTSRVGYLTAPSDDTPLAVGLAFARDHLDLLGLSEVDLADYEVTDSVWSAVTGATHLYLRQTLSGIPVVNGQLQFNINRDGRVISVNNAFIGHLSGAVNSATPTIHPVIAVATAARHLGLESAFAPEVRGMRGGDRAETTIQAPELAVEPIVAGLGWLPVGPGEVRLVWGFTIATPDRLHVYDFTVDAADGAVWTRFDRVLNDNYLVYRAPVESPNHTLPVPPADGRLSVVDPADATASPYGWHDTNGVAGPEYLNLRGNNVHAYDDRNNDNAPPTTEPSCGATLSCAFPADLTQPPSGYVAATVANLFYWNNYIHDVQYGYGFDESAGNFQVNNYGHGGLGNDSIKAEAQDGSGLNNANFATTVDGVSPRMQMYIWDPASPDRSSDFDSGVIVHEYGHGISTRLVGGPSTVSCLNNRQQPGEGLSDWWALVYTATPGDLGSTGRGIGTYVLNQPTTGLGIRTQRYSTSPVVNTWTYASINGMSVPHGVGSVWAQAAWEVYWALVDVHGYSPNLYDVSGGAGNQRAMLYINEGLKNTVCSPTFTDVRDGIIAAAADNYGGVDVCLIWKAFAGFGLGVDAVSGGKDSTNPTNGFALPESCCVAAPTGLTVTPVGSNRLDLAWAAVPAATSYKIRRGTGTCPGSSVATIATGITATTYSDTGVAAGTYAYQVVAVDAERQCDSAPSPCSSGTAVGPPGDGLDQLYDAGGPGLGRKITADSGSVLIKATSDFGLTANGGTSGAVVVDAVGGPVDILRSGGVPPELELRAGAGSAARSWVVRTNVKSSTQRVLEFYDQAAAVAPFRLFAGPQYTLTLRNGRVGIVNDNPSGTLDVNGSIYQRGKVLHADDVFSAGRRLAAIDEHAAAMWSLGHLPAVPGATVDAAGDDVVEDGAHRRGMLEELEVAHIYIDELEGRVGQAADRLALARADAGELASLAARLAAPTADRRLPTVVRVATTLDQAYDSGGKGLGRTITASSGPVALTGASTLLSLKPSVGGTAMEVSGGGVRVQRTDGAAASLVLESTGGTGIAQRFLVTNQPAGYLEFRDDLVSKKSILKIYNGGANNTVVVRDSKVGIGTESPVGTLDVNGAIYQRGKLLHADDVFARPGEVPSLTTHSARMWQGRHLPAVPAREVDDEGREVVEIGAHRRGMLTELEIAHIYIAELDQLVRRADALVVEAETRLEGQRRRVARLLASSGGANHRSLPVVRIGTLQTHYGFGRTLTVDAGPVEISGPTSPPLRVEKTGGGTAVEVTGGNLRVARTAGEDAELRLVSTGGAAAQTWMLQANTFYKFLALRDQQLGRSPCRLYSAGALDNTLVIKGGRAGIGTLNPAGTLDVNGPIYQRAKVLHADYVFDPDYQRPSIDEHAGQMWAGRHLPAVPGAQRDADGQEVLELGAHRRGMLEELELAHIYLEQLDARARAATALGQRLGRDGDALDRLLADVERSRGLRPAGS